MSTLLIALIANLGAAVSPASAGEERPPNAIEALRFEDVSVYDEEGKLVGIWTPDKLGPLPAEVFDTKDGLRVRLRLEDGTDVYLIAAELHLKRKPAALSASCGPLAQSTDVQSASETRTAASKGSSEACQ